MVETQNRRVSKDAWRVFQAEEWRASKRRHGWAGLFLGLAALAKFMVLVLSLATGEGSIAFFTFPFVFIALFMDMAEYDRLAKLIAQSDARMIGSESPRKTRRLAMILGWMWGVVFGLTFLVFVVAAAKSESTASPLSPWARPLPTAATDIAPGLVSHLEASWSFLPVELA